MVKLLLLLYTLYAQLSSRELKHKFQDTLSTQDVQLMIISLDKNESNNHTILLSDISGIAGCAGDIWSVHG